MTANDATNPDKVAAPINCWRSIQNPQPVIDAYAALLAVDDSRALIDSGSTLNAPVRLANLSKLVF